MLGAIRAAQPKARDATHPAGQEDRAGRPMAPTRGSVNVWSRPDDDRGPIQARTTLTPRVRRHPRHHTIERPLSTDTETTTALHDPPVPIRTKLAAAWTSFMFLYIYVDYLALYKPGAIDDILVGVVHEFDTGPTFVALALTLMAIPILMILLATTLPARVNRATNLVVATLYIPVTMYNAAGESWTYSYFYGLSIGLEVLLLAFILRSAWTWPRTPGSLTAEPAAPRRSQVQMGR
jgi:hypothetical protein